MRAPMLACGLATIVLFPLYVVAASRPRHGGRLRRRCSRFRRCSSSTAAWRARTRSRSCSPGARMRRSTVSMRHRRVRTGSRSGAGATYAVDGNDGGLASSGRRAVRHRAVPVDALRSAARAARIAAIALRAARRPRARDRTADGSVASAATSRASGGAHWKGTHRSSSHRDIDRRVVCLARHPVTRWRCFRVALWPRMAHATYGARYPLRARACSGSCSRCSRSV